MARPRKNRILISYATNGWLRQEFVESLFQTRDGLQPRYQVKMKAAVGGPMIAKHRNILTEEFLKDPRQFDYLLFTDTDMVFRDEHVKLLLAADKPIVGALYYGVPHDSLTTFPVALTKQDGHLLPIPREELPDSGCLEVDAVGMGLCLIKREVLETLGADHKKLWPFAETQVNGDARGEDVAFCLRAKDEGFATWLCVDARVGHVKSFTI